MDANTIKGLAIDLMDAVKQRNLSAFELKTDGFSLKIQTHTAAAGCLPMTEPVQQPAAAAAPAAAPAPLTDSGTTVDAPLVGIFYGAPAPEEPPFIEVGQMVKKGDTLFIIEAMKTMNEIAAPCDGTVSRILAQNGDMVEYKQPLVVIE